MTKVRYYSNFMLRCARLVALHHKNPSKAVDVVAQWAEMKTFRYFWIGMKLIGHVCLLLILVNRVRKRQQDYAE